MRQGSSPTTAIWGLAAVVLAGSAGGAGCERAPLAFPNPDAGVGDASLDGDGRVEVGGAPRVDWAIPIGPQASPTIAGSTALVGAVPLPDGGVIVAGIFYGTVAFAPDRVLVAAGSVGQGFVARYRRDQQLVWVTALAAEQSRVAGVAALPGDEVALTGWFKGTLTIAQPGADPSLVNAGAWDAFVMRVAADGSIRWLTRAGGTGEDIARAISARKVSSPDVPGGLAIAITGAVGNEPSFGFDAGGGFPVGARPGLGPIYVAGLDGDGSFRWVAFAGDGVPGQGYAVGVASDGGAVVTGYTNGKSGFGLDPSGAKLTIDPQEGRAFVARWDGEGQPLWAQPLGGPRGEGHAISVGSGDDIITAGQFEGEARFGRDASGPRLFGDLPNRWGVYLATLSPSGATRWARRLTGVGLRVWSLHETPGGDLLLAGSFGGSVLLDPEGPMPLTLFSKGNNDAAFFRLAGDGVLRWATTAGGLGQEEGTDFALASDGTSWAVGHYNGPATIGGEGAVTLTSGTDGNGFLLHLAR